MVRKILKRGWRPVLVLILLIMVWELASKLFAIQEWLLPAPSSIGQEAIAGWGDYKHHLRATIQLSMMGFVIGSSVGIVVAVCLHLVPVLREALYPLLIISQNIPIIILAPLLVVWLGFGILPKIIVITLVCFFPITIAALDGFRQTSGELKHYMEMAGANKRQIFYKLEWPHALPSLFSGLKIAATYSVMGAVISEWLGASEGMGYYMTLASSSFRTDRVFVAILFIVTLSLLFFAILSYAERKVVKTPAQQED